MKQLFIGCLLCATLISTVNAQNVSEIYKMSQNNGAYTTARSSALGGAFTSLGADMSSITSNPAGLGMYTTSEISITPSLKISSTASSAEENNMLLKHNSSQTKGALNNMGVVYTFRDDNNTVNNVSIGLSYNTSNNQNTRFTALNSGSSISIADMFSAQLYNINPKDLRNGYDIFSPRIFGAIGAYKTGLIFDVAGDPYLYAPSYNNTDGKPVGSLLAGDIVYPEMTRLTKGVTGDYNAAIGTSIKDILYLGITLGVSDYAFSQFDNYSEETASSNKGDLAGLHYNQALYQNGIAFNFIVGATVQPVKGLRIGASFHAPKVYSISEEYSTYQESSFFVKNNTIKTSNSSSPILLNNYRVKTPPRLSVGLSYALAKIGLITVDYERVWYNKMSVRDINYKPGEVTIDDEIAKTYKLADNIKAGIEANVYGGTFLRAGYARYGNANQLIEEKYGLVQNFSGGIGYRNPNFFVDFTYVMVHSEMAPFRFFDYDNTLRSGAVTSATLRQHNLILTAGVKF